MGNLKSIFITVRTASTRLPNKATLLLNDQGLTIIEYIIMRVKLSKRADQIVLCTTNEPDDMVLVDIAKKHSIKFYQGPTNDKLERWNEAAIKFNAGLIITVDGDDLFCEPELIDLAFYQWSVRPYDFIHAPYIITGAFTYGMLNTALKKVCKIKDTDDTEMMWPYFLETGLFSIAELEAGPLYYRDDTRMTLDYPEDLDFFMSILNLIGFDYVPLKRIVEVIAENPYIRDINFFRQREFLENQRIHSQLQLKDL